MVHKVSTIRQEVREYTPKWELVRNLMKTKVKDYIFDLEDPDTIRNKRYKDSAVLTNFTKRTRDGLVGAVFTKDPTYNLPSNLEYLLEDTQGKRVGLHRVAKKVVSDALEVGRGGLLVDYPADDIFLTDQQRIDAGIKARIYDYPTESIINWNEEKIGGEYKLSMVVLKENIKKLQDDGFTWRDSYQFLILRLERMDEMYIYTQEVLDEDGNPVKPKIAPTMSNGRPWNEIPFVFYGSMDNDAQVDEPPLLDLATINIAHYRNSADNEENIYLCGQPFFGITSDFSKEEFEAENPAGLKVGARHVTYLGINGDIKMAQTNPNDRIGVAMREKIEEAAMLGARLITSHARIEKAESARMAYSSETSVMMTIVQNANEAITRALKFCAMFMGSATESITYELNSEFYDKITDPNMYMMMLQHGQAGFVTQEEIRRNLKNNNLLENDAPDTVEVEIQDTSGSETENNTSEDEDLGNQ